MTNFFYIFKPIVKKQTKYKIGKVYFALVLLLIKRYVGILILI